MIRQCVSINLPYILPKDMREASRLDFQHFLLRVVLGGNYLAPLQQPETILDVGSGSGRWALEMARDFPQAHVTACDLLKQESQGSSAPLNVHFVQGDLLKGLPFPDQSFDFVHQRLLCLAIPRLSWPGVVRELVRVTKPGGWIELVETQLLMANMGPVLTQLLKWTDQVGKKRGVEAWRVPDLAAEMRLAELSHISTRRFDLPAGNWGGRIGSMMRTDGLAIAEAVKPLVISQLGIDPATYDRMRALLPDDYERARPSIPFFITFGQRV